MSNTLIDTYLFIMYICKSFYVSKHNSFRGYSQYMYIAY